MNQCALGIDRALASVMATTITTAQAKRLATKLTASDSLVELRTLLATSDYAPRPVPHQGAGLGHWKAHTMAQAQAYTLDTVTEETARLAEQIAKLDKRMDANLQIAIARVYLARAGLRLASHREPGRYVRVTSENGEHSAWYRCAPTEGSKPMH